MINGILNMMRRESEKVVAQQANTRMGIVDSYDPVRYCAKVLLQPEDVLTGFLPVATEWVGNGWGLFCPPTAGDVVDVHFQEWGKNAGYISKRFFSNPTPPLQVNSGEFWIVHKSGSFLKFTNDGKVSVNSASDMNFVSGGAMNLSAAGAVNINSGTDMNLSAEGSTNIAADNKLILHGDNEATFDAGGTGFKYTPALIDTYTDGVTVNDHNPNPPEIPT